MTVPPDSNNNSSSPNVSILALIGSPQRYITLQESLSPERYTVEHCESLVLLVEKILHHKTSTAIDCLLLDLQAIDQEVDSSPLFAELRQSGIFLPAVLLNKPGGLPVTCYHQAEVTVSQKNLSEVGTYIDSAIKRFLRLSPDEVHWEVSQLPMSQAVKPQADLSSPAFVLEQQRLARKLKERLGYLGVYYKRSPENFYQNLSSREQQQLLDELTAKYQAILLSYFSEATQINRLIDDFVNLSFFTDISVTQIVELHMKLIDEYSKQLKLEGRSEAVLVNYRLALLDIISHLCEMYRRSIPRDSTLLSQSSHQ